MDRYLAGDQTGYAELVRRYERELFNYIRRLTGDPNLAEDVFQNTFLTVHVKRHLFRVGRPFRPWLYTLATNQAIDAMRRNGRHQRPSLDRPHESDGSDSPTSLADIMAGVYDAPGQRLEKAETAELVRASVQDLPEHLRETVVLNYYQGMKYKEIAGILGIPVGTVKSRLHAAISRLGEAWKRMGLVDAE
jgi:RNA polymerase sigma-70 factor (ECF subfamily)